MFNTRSEADEPEGYDKLSPSEKEILQAWIAANLESIASFNTGCTSYGLKHFFEQSANGFYIHNGAFKGAMLAAGYRVKDSSLQNWNFNVSKKSVTRLYKLSNERFE